METAAFAFPTDLVDEGVDVERLRLDLATYGDILDGGPFSVALRPSLARKLGAARVDFSHYG